MKAKVYFANILGELGRPSAEIAGCEYVCYESGHNLSEITSKILDSLREEGYL